MKVMVIGRQLSPVNPAEAQGVFVCPMLLSASQQQISDPLSRDNGLLLVNRIVCDIRMACSGRLFKSGDRRLNKSLLLAISL